MKQEAQLQLQALLDGELSPAEMRRVEQWMAQDPQAQALFAELQHTRALLVGNELPRQIPASRDFFWSRIEQDIQRLESMPAPSGFALPSWTKDWWKLFAPVGAVAMLCLVLLPLWHPPQPPAMAALHGMEIEAGTPDSSVITFRSDMEGISVVWVDTQ